MLSSVFLYVIFVFVSSFCCKCLLFIIDLNRNTLFDFISQILHSAELIYLLKRPDDRSVLENGY